MGIALPRTIEEVAALRWVGAGGGGDAAPWIHLLALLLTALVVLPRLGLAALAWVAGRRLQLPGSLPLLVATYARRVLGAGRDAAATEGAEPVGGASSNPVARTVTTLIASADCTVARALPA